MSAGKAGQPHWNATAALPAALLLEKAVVLRGSRLCRTLSTGNSVSAGKKPDSRRPDLGFGYPRSAV